MLSLSVLFPMVSFVLLLLIITTVLLWLLLLLLVNKSDGDGDEDENDCEELVLPTELAAVGGARKCNSTVDVGSK